MTIGAVLAGASKKQQEVIEQIAAKVGMAFQIQDDILDVTGDSEVLGKTAGSDEKNQKTTYVTVRGLELARGDVQRYSDEAIRILRELPCENEFLYELILNLVHRSS